MPTLLELRAAGKLTLRNGVQSLVTNKFICYITRPTTRRRVGNIKRRAPIVQPPEV